MNTKLRAKIKVGSVIPERDKDGRQTSERLFCYADNDPNSENRQWASQGNANLHLDMTINNPQAFGTVKPGDDFYLEFTPAEKSETARV